MRHLLSIADLEQSALLALIERSAQLGAEPAAGSRALSGKCVGLFFRQTSTRTRTSFAAGAARLGACPLIFGPGELQVETGESLEDTARVMSGYVHGLVVRTASPLGELRAMASAARIPIINAMTAEEHPTQAISDFAMLKRKFGHLSGLHLLYVGEGNSTAAALALAASRIQGFKITLMTPRGYGIPAETRDLCSRLADRHGGDVVQLHDWPDESAPADAVYATRWQTTGTSKADVHWRDHFRAFQVTEAMMTKRAKPESVFMHDLPAVRGEDCESIVLDGVQSIAFEQATQKMHTATAILEWAL